MPATTSMESAASVETAAAVEAASSVETAAAVETAKTRLSTERVASGDPAMRKPTEGARMNSGRAVRHVGRVSHLMPRKPAVRAHAVIEVRLTAMEMIPIDDGCAVRNVSVVIVLNPAVMMPVEIPVMPSPSEACE